MKFFEKLAAGSAVVLAPVVPAMAAIDVTAVATEINDTLAPVGAIGAAVLLVIVAIKAYKWVRRAF